MPPGMAAFPVCVPGARIAGILRPSSSMPPGMAAFPVAFPAQDRRHPCRPAWLTPCRQGWRRSRWRSRPQDRRHPAGPRPPCRRDGGVPGGVPGLRIAGIPPALAGLHAARDGGVPGGVPGARIAGILPARCASMPPGMAALPVALGARITSILPALAGLYAARDGGAPGGGVPGLRIAGILPALAPALYAARDGARSAFPASGSPASCALAASMPPGMAALPVAFPASGSPASCRPLAKPLCRQGWRRSRWRSRLRISRHPAGLAASMPPGMAALPAAFPASDRRILPALAGLYAARDGGAPGGVPGLRIAGILPALAGLYAARDGGVPGGVPGSIHAAFPQ